VYIKYILELIKRRLVISYSIGNVLNTVSMLLLLPTFLSIDPLGGGRGASGLLASQLAGVLATYSFPIILPRILKDLDFSQYSALIAKVLFFQVAVGLGSIFLLICIDPSRINSVQAISAFIIGYSAVLQWQWFHIGRDSGVVQAILLIVSRVTLIFIEIFAILKFPLIFNVVDINFGMLACIAILPVYSTAQIFLCKKIIQNQALNSFGASFWNEIRLGRDLFVSSLLSSVYLLGPSSIVAMVNPSHLVMLQQFDRLRMSASNMVAILLNSIYPTLIKYGANELTKKFIITQRKIVLPLAFVSIILIPLSLIVPQSEFWLLTHLHLSLSAIFLGGSAAIAASASNTIAMTFLHPLNNDKSYRSAIFFGAVFFVLSVFFSKFLIGNMWQFLMMSAAFAENCIMLLLWKRARFLISANGRLDE